MPVEQLTFGFHVGLRLVPSLVVSPGDAKLTDLAKTLLQRLRARLRGGPVCVPRDAGACKNTHALLSLTETKKQVTLVRAPRRPHYVAAWKRIPEAAWLRISPQSLPSPATAGAEAPGRRGQSAQPYAAKSKQHEHEHEHHRAGCKNQNGAQDADRRAGDHPGGGTPGFGKGQDAKDGQPDQGKWE